LTKQIEDTTKERDTLRIQIVQRTQERDNAQGNLSQFNKELQGLAVRVETVVNNPQAPGLTIINASRRNE
jgi:hypothetical protein